jgi:hypothetical protein
MGLSKTGRLPRDARRPQAISSGRNSRMLCCAAERMPECRSFPRRLSPNDLLAVQGATKTALDEHYIPSLRRTREQI